MTIAANLGEIRERVAQSARRAGRAPDEVALMAVSKLQPAEAILEAMEAGQHLFGENRVQEFAAKSEQLGERAAAAQFHLIGHLQSNKAARAAELFGAVDSVDSLRLAEKLNAERERRAAAPLEILVEVNIGGEGAKAGLALECDELREILRAQRRLSHLSIRGLMTVPPATEEAEGARLYFRRLRQLRDRLREESGLELAELSMGMSHDFEVAIEEGSTCVRVGTAIFGARPAPAAREESR